MTDTTRDAHYYVRDLSTTIVSPSKYVGTSMTDNGIVYEIFCFFFSSTDPVRKFNALYTYTVYTPYMCLLCYENLMEGCDRRGAHRNVVQ